MLIPYTPLPLALDSVMLSERVQGLTVVIEVPKGEIRYGKGWQHRMPADYGYIEGTMGADGDEMDCYLGPDPASNMVYVVDQSRMDDHSKFDEHKCMIGFLSLKEARAIYIKGHTHGEEIFRAITPMTMTIFKSWLKHGDIDKPVNLK